MFLCIKDPHRGNKPHSVAAYDRENGLQAQRGAERRPDQPRLSHFGGLLPAQQENEEAVQRVQGKDEGGAYTQCGLMATGLSNANAAAHV